MASSQFSYVVPHISAPSYLNCNHEPPTLLFIVTRRPYMAPSFLQCTSPPPTVSELSPGRKLVLPAVFISF